jgi:outer membrane protein assembly factor BamB
MTPCTRALIGATTFLVPLCVQILGADSGMYRGPENNGIYPETGILRKWPEGGPKLLWKQRLSGASFSSVTVADGRVCATEGSMAAIHVIGLDGRERAVIPAGPSIFKRFGGGSRGTTVVRGRMAVTTSPESDVYAVDLDKRETRWQFNVSRDLGEELPQGGWGYCESPALCGDKIVLGSTATRPEDPLLMAFDIETGEMAWGTGWGNPTNTKYHYQSPPSSPACFRHNGRNLIAFSAHSYHVCVDADSGRLLWNIPNRGSHCLTPIYNDGLLLIHDDNGWRIDKSEKARSGIRMLKLSDDGSSYETLWTRWDFQAGYSHGVILDGRVYIYGLPVAQVEKGAPAGVGAAGGATKTGDAGGDDSEVPVAESTNVNRNAAFLCLDAKTGALIASQPVSEGFAAPGHVVAADGLVFFLELVGKGASTNTVVRTWDPKTSQHVMETLWAGIELRPRLVMFEPTEKGFEKTGVLDIPIDKNDASVKEVEWQARTPPVIAEGRLFVRHGSIFAFDVRAEPRAHGWRQNGSGVAEESEPPLDWNERRNVLWTADLSVSPACSPVTDGEKALVMGAEGELLCLDAASGKTMWRHAVTEKRTKKADGESVGQPTPLLAMGLAFAAASDGTVVALRGDGTRQWKSSAPCSGKSPMASPLLAGKTLIVQGGELMGLDAENGKTLWRVPVPGNKTYGTPAIVGLHDCRLIATAWGAVVAADDGTVVAKGLPEAGGFSPAANGRDLYVWEDSADSARGGRIVALRFPARRSPEMKPAVLWERATPGQRPGCAPLAADGMLYGLTDAGTALAWVAKDGELSYSQKLGSPDGRPADSSHGRSLVAAGGRVYAVNADGCGLTCVLDAGRKFRQVASYVVEHETGEPAFRADRVFLTAGARLYCVGGTAVAMPEPIATRRVAPLAARSVDKGLPVQSFGAGVPDRWLVCGPIPGKTLETDHLANIGGRAGAMPVENETVAIGGTNFAFRPLDPTNRFKDSVSADVPAINVKDSLSAKPNTTAYFFTVVSNDAPRYVRLAVNTPGAKQLPDRLEWKVWLGGEPMVEGETAKLGTGFYPLMVQVGLGKFDAWGKVWMAPRFEDVTASFAAIVARNEEDLGVWREHVVAAAKPFVLTPVGVRRGVPEGVGMNGPPAATKAAVALAEGKSLMDALGMKFVAIPGKPYAMQTTEVTQGQWFSLMGTEPWKGMALTSVGPEYPVAHVSWHDAVEFANRMTRMDGKNRYRLPKEDEWRHAAQTGLDGRWCFGSDGSNLVRYAWYQKNAETNVFARKVAQLEPSAWGLYDINGNVAEWCGDERGRNRPGTSSLNPAERYRIVKGGAWYSVDWFCDNMKSPQYGPLFKSNGVGFRVLREPVAAE